MLHAAYRDVARHRARFLLAGLVAAAGAWLLWLAARPLLIAVPYPDQPVVAQQVSSSIRAVAPAVVKSDFMAVPVPAAHWVSMARAGSLDAQVRELSEARGAHAYVLPTLPVGLPPSALSDALSAALYERANSRAEAVLLCVLLVLVAWGPLYQVLGWSAATRRQRAV